MALKRKERPTGAEYLATAQALTVSPPPLSGDLVGCDGWSYTVTRATPRYSLAIRLEHPSNGVYVLHWRPDQFTPALHLAALLGLFPEVLDVVYTLCTEHWTERDILDFWGRIP
jgi:hypothetical protein